MAKKKTKGRSDPFVSQANSLSLVRYGPEISALTALMRQAEDDYQQSVRGAKSTAQLIQSSVDRAAPTVRAAYDRSQGEATQAFGIAAPDLAALPAGSPFRAVAGIEQAGLTGRLAEQAASTTAELQDRRVAAQEGSQWAQQAARRQLSSDRGKISQRATDLAGEQGAFTASTIQDLIGSDAKARQDAAAAQGRLDQSERNSVRSSGIDPDTGQPIPGGRLDPKAKPKEWASDASQAKASDVIQTALAAAEGLSKRGVSRADAGQALRVGAKPRPIYRTVTDPITKKRTQQRVLVDGVPKMTSSLPRIDQTLYLQAALDLAYDGHLSRRTQHLLHQRGIQLAPLGVTTLGAFQENQRHITRPGTAPAVGGQRPT